MGAIPLWTCRGLARVSLSPQRQGREGVVQVEMRGPRDPHEVGAFLGVVVRPGVADSGGRHGLEESTPYGFVEAVPFVVGRPVFAAGEGLAFRAVVIGVPALLIAVSESDSLEVLDVVIRELDRLEGEMDGLHQGDQASGQA